MPDTPTMTLAILAPGLIGSSVGRAAFSRGVARRVIVWARRSEVRTALKRENWCHETAETPEGAASGADLVLVAAPVDAIVPLVRQISGKIPTGAIVTDVGSVKGMIAREGQTALGKRAHFVGAHPMAGSEKTGWQHGTANLFEGRTCFVTPMPGTDPAAAEATTQFWRQLGAHVVTVEPDQHDMIVAHISHLPQAIASALCSFLSSKDPAWQGYAGGGLRDTTRIASSDPEIWKSILEQNRAEVLRALEGFKKELAGLEASIERGDWTGLADQLARGRKYREGLMP